MQVLCVNVICTSVCRFVRREKEIAVAQCEALKEEALRHRQRVEHQNREIKELHETLNNERMKIQVGKNGTLKMNT